MSDLASLDRRRAVGVAGATSAIMATLERAVGDDVELAPIPPNDVYSPLGLDLLIVSVLAEWRSAALIAGGPPVIFLGERADHDEEYAAIERGAIGFLSLDLPITSLRRAIHAALGGEAVFRRRTLGLWLRENGRGGQRASSGGQPMLSSRQQQILRLIADGATNKEIAVRLGVTDGTVESHVTRLLKRIGAPNRAAAVRALHAPVRLPVR